MLRSSGAAIQLLDIEVISRLLGPHDSPDSRKPEKPLKQDSNVPLFAWQ